MIPSRRGKTLLLLLDGYTYSQKNKSLRWVCSQARSNSCRARVRIDEHRQVERVNTHHSHGPPEYIKEDDFCDDN
jgi:hypothetical protein